MCGILGTNIRDIESIKSAAETFAYRGPDYTGFYDSGNFILIHHRLSIIDPDSRSNQPLFDDSGKISIVFNGEIYNYKQIRKILEIEYHLKTESDTEILIYAYKKWGKEMLRRLNGMFAFVIYDEENQKLFMARDHAGIKPLYYFNDIDGKFIFSSELKGIALLCKKENINLTFDKEAVELFTAIGYIPSPMTLYNEIKHIEKSSFLEFDLKTKKITGKGFYHPDAVSIGKDIEEVIEESVRRNLVSDVPVGLFFSGGTDSSMIAALLKKNNINLETFSIILAGKNEDKRCFEGIAKHLNIKAHAFEFTISDFDLIYEEIMGRIDEPCFDNSIFPTYFVSKKAAEHVKVVLSGEGGDEIFLGYPRMKNLIKMKSNQSGKMNFFDSLFFILPDFKAKNKLFEKIFAFVGDAPAYYLLAMSPSKNIMTKNSWKKAKILIVSSSQKPLEYDRKLYLENDLLRKTDMATSLASIEGRVPLLDSEIIETVSHLSSNTLLSGGVLKSVLKKILEKYVPSEYVYRNKSGFGMHLSEFFEKSQKLSLDLDLAIEFLTKDKIIEPIKISRKKLIIRYPNYAFALVTLYRAIKNTRS